MSFERFRDLIKKATEAGIIKWEPTGDEVDCEVCKDKERGFKTKIGDFEIRTIVFKTMKTSRFLWTTRVSYPTVYGLEIKKADKTLVFSSDPESLPGKKVDNFEPWLFVVAIQRTIEEVDLITALTNQIARMMYKAFHR